MMDKKLILLVGAVCIAEGSCLICLTCNLVTIWRTVIPSNMPHLLEAATSMNLMIEDPTDLDYGLFGDAGRSNRRNLAEVKCNLQDKSLGEIYQQALLARDMINLGVHLYLLCSTVAKLYLGYHPFIWRLTARITDDSVYRALCYFAFDNFLNRCSDVPVQFVLITFNDPDRFSALQLRVIWNIIYSLGFASVMYLWINVIEKIGVAGWCFTPFAMVIGKLLLLTGAIGLIKHRPPPPLPDGLNASLRDLCSKLGYPDLNIRDADADPYPLVGYYSALFTDVVMYTPLLLKRLSNDKMVAIVAHELGKKRYRYWSITYLSFFARSAAACYIYMKAYDNVEVDEMFGFLNDLPHPIVSMYLVETYILLPFMQVLQLICNFANRRVIYWCDHFACSLGYSTGLKNALLTLACTSKQYPIFDGSWYTTFMASVPRVQDRVLEIDLHDFHNSRQP